MLKRLIKLPVGKYSFFLFGPRQTGKTTLINSLLSPDFPVIRLNLLLTKTLIKYKTNPSLLHDEIEFYFKDPCNNLDNKSLCESRNTDDKAVASGQYGDKDLFDNLVLTYDYLPKFCQNAFPLLLKLLDYLNIFQLRYIRFHYSSFPSCISAVSELF